MKTAKNKTFIISFRQNGHEMYREITELFKKFKQREQTRISSELGFPVRITSAGALLSAMRIATAAEPTRKAATRAKKDDDEVYTAALKRRVADAEELSRLRKDV